MPLQSIVGPPGVKVFVGVRVGVCVEVGVLVAVGVSVWVLVAVDVGVGVGVGVSADTHPVLGKHCSPSGHDRGTPAHAPLKHPKVKPAGQVTH
jgi:hypothetical protein